MACGLHTKLEAAYAATREAFDEAHKTDALADTTLNLLFVYYQGIKKIKEELKDHTHEDIVLPDGTYDPDYNITLPTDSLNFDINNLAYDASAPVTFGAPAGEDVLSFTTTGNTTVTVPEHEDDEKIVL
tara:strand:- start:43 stop:429 length:387 start_codon:yes stop_codon:yes gene_type:complete